MYRFWFLYLLWFAAVIPEALRSLFAIYRHKIGKPFVKNGNTYQRYRKVVGVVPRHVPGCVVDLAVTFGVGMAGGYLYPVISVYMDLSMSGSLLYLAVWYLTGLVCRVIEGLSVNYTMRLFEVAIWTRRVLAGFGVGFIVRHLLAILGF